MGTVESSAGDPAKVRRRVRNAVVIGTALEWFDFFLFASMAALVFGRVFFPSFDPATATLASIATFGVGFLARPLGGIVFGALSDRFGRKRVLLASFIMMGTASGLIGLLPSYAAIGIAAPVLLVLLRLLQGLGAGAEFSPAIAMSYEHADPENRGRQGAWPSMGTNLGLLLASTVVAVLMTASDDFVLEYGWRIPFIASFALVAIGIVLRTRMPETPEFERVADKSEKSPLKSLLRGHWRPVLVALVVMFGSTAASYLFKTFSLAYIATYRGVGGSIGATGVAIATAIAILVVPIAGRMCDRFSPYTVLAAGGALVGLLAFPFFWMLNTDRTIAIFAALIIGTGIAMPTMTAAQGAFFASLFPTAVRGSGIGTGREIGGAIAGGLAPVAALALVQSSPSNSTFSVSMIFLGASACVVGGVYWARRLAQRTPVADELTPAPVRAVSDKAIA